MDLPQAIVSFLFGAASTYLGLYWRIRKELEADYDKDLRACRLRVYTGLWSALEPLAKYARPAPVVGATLKALSAALRRWYFEEGGIYMSEGARDSYFALQDELQTALDRLARDDDALPAADFERLREAGSRLRTAMTVDVGTRRKPLLAEEASA